MHELQTQCILESRYFHTSTRETNESECNCNEPERWGGIYQGLVIDQEAEQWINQHHLRAAGEERSSRHPSFNPNKMAKFNFRYKKTDNIQLTRLDHNDSTFHHDLKLIQLSFIVR